MNVYVYNKDTQIPEDETCYIVAKGGIFLKKKLDLIESLTPVDKISFLEDIPNYAKLNISKIPKKLFGDILSLFREVYRLYKSEVAVLLYYNKDKKTFKVHVPEQEVSFASVSYKGNHTIKDFILVGSIHSHSSMGAFHSGTDTSDEEKFDGIHFTIGKVDKEPFFDLCSSIAVNGLRVPTDPMEYVDGLEVREFTNYFPQMFRPSFEEIDGDKIYKNFVKTTTSYIIEGDFSFNPVWLEKIKEKTYPKFEGVHTRYTFKDGKLIKLDEPKIKDYRFDLLNSKSLTFGFDDKKFESKEKDFDPCDDCIHNKNSKAYKNEDIPKYDDKTDFTEFDMYNYGFGD